MTQDHGSPDATPDGDAFLTFSQEVTEKAVIVTVAGEVDMTTGARFRSSMIEGLRAPVGHPLIVDLTRVEFFSSTGLSALAAATQEAAKREEPLRIVVGGNRMVHRAFEVSGMDQTLELYESVADALDATSPDEIR